MLRLFFNILRYTAYVLSAVLAIISIFLAYLYSLPSPSEEQIMEECNAEINSGSYSKYEDPLAYCVEDYWKAAGASDGLWVVSLTLFFLAAVFLLIGRKLKR